MHGNHVRFLFQLCRWYAVCAESFGKRQIICILSRYLQVRYLRFISDIFGFKCDMVHLEYFTFKLQLQCSLPIAAIDVPREL